MRPVSRQAQQLSCAGMLPTELVVKILALAFDHPFMDIQILNKLVLVRAALRLPAERLQLSVQPNSMTPVLKMVRTACTGRH